MKKKLSSRRGETLAETLVAVLIVSFASVLLASMLTSSSRLNKTAKENDEELYAAVTAAETQSGTGTDGTVTVSVAGESIEKNVLLYCSDPDAPVWSYQVQ